MKRRSRMPTAAPTMKPAEPREDLLTPAQAARYLGISPWTLRLWVQLKKISHVRYGKQVVRFKPSVLDKFIATNTELADEK